MRARAAAIERTPGHDAVGDDRASDREPVAASAPHPPASLPFVE
jgi:hypothetical protein